MHPAHIDGICERFLVKSKDLPIATENNNMKECMSAKRLAGLIRVLKEQIFDELNIRQKIDAENCQLKINIHHLQERLHELHALCKKCEISNAEIGCQKRRYSEQLTKISKLISEQNFDAANWAIILDEMAFVNRELFEILLSTAIAERQALQIEITEEQKYRNRATKLVLKRIELRQALHSQMNRYETLNMQISQTETNIINLQKTIDVYDAEYWQLNDAKHDLQSQIFQLQELLRQSQYHCQSSKLSSLNDEDDDCNGGNAKLKIDSCLMRGEKYNITIPCYEMSKEMNNGTTNLFNVVKMVTQSETTNKTDHESLLIQTSLLQTGSTNKKRADNEISRTSSNIQSEFLWTKKRNNSSRDQSISWNTSSISSNISTFLVQHNELSSDSNLMKLQRKTKAHRKQNDDTAGSATMESFNNTRSWMMITSECDSLMDEKQEIVDKINTDQKSTTDLKSSDEDNIVTSSDWSNSWDSDNEITQSTSESISLSETSDTTTSSFHRSYQLMNDKDQRTKQSSLFSGSSGKHNEIHRPFHFVLNSENSCEVAINSKVKYAERLEDDANVELWEEISEQTFLREITDK